MAECRTTYLKPAATSIVDELDKMHAIGHQLEALARHSEFLGYGFADPAVVRETPEKPSSWSSLNLPYHGP